MYYETMGTGEPLILIGGLTADHNVWRSTARLFAKHFQVIIFDNRGAGQSSAPDLPYSTQMMAQDTVALMDALSVPKAHFIGHSMGGCIAQQIAIHYPEKVDKMIIACARAKPSYLANMVLSTRLKLIEAGVSDALIAEYMMPFLFSEAFLKKTTQVKGFIQWTLKNPFPQSKTGFKNQFHAVETHDVIDKLNQIDSETLIISGEQDCLMPPRMGEAFAKEIPNATFKIIPSSAHMPHVEQSQLFSQLAMAFFEPNS